MIITSIAALALAATSDPKAAALTRLYLEWRGARFERTAAIHAKGTIKVMGLEGTIDRWSTADGAEREDRVTAAFSVSEGNGPAGGWSRGPSGQVDRMSEDGRTALREDAQVDFGAAMRPGSGATLTLVGEETRVGRKWQVLRVSFPTGSTYDLLVDGGTGELEGERTRRDGRTSFTDFSDWRLVDGVRVAFREDALGVLPGQTRRVDYSTVVINARPSPSLLDQPATRRIAVFASGVRSTGPLSIELVDRRRIFIKVQIAGRNVDAMIDSGAASSVIDNRLAREIGVGSSGSGGAIGSTGRAAVSMGSATDVHIGALRLSALPLAVMDLSGVSTQLGRPLQFVLGRDLFDQLVVSIDVQRRTMTLTDPSTFKPERGAVPVTLTAEGPLRVVEGSVEAAEPVKLHFDLGNGTPLVLYPGYWKSRNLMDGRLSSKSLVGGISGSVTADIIAISSLSIGGTGIDDVPTILMPATGGAGDTNRIAGNVGFPLLSRFRLAIDYPHDLLWLVPFPASVKAPFDRDRTGLGAQLGADGLMVKVVAPASPASAAKLQVGDVITAVDGRAVGKDYGSSELSRWRFGAPGRHVRLTLSDDSMHVLTLGNVF